MPIHYQNVYNASEGFFAFQDTLDSDDMLLHLDNGVFYEFIPFDSELQRDKAVSIGRVETGINYSLAISTNSGLWRYVIGDTIEFTSTAPHRIRITGRTKHFINVFGEEVTVCNADKAIAASCQETDSEVCEYTVAPIFADGDIPGKHEWAIEFTKAPASTVILCLNTGYTSSIAKLRLSGQKNRQPGYETTFSHIS
jgi:hypothetical protein